jgi:osmotically-inducible protein OsmY
VIEDQVREDIIHRVLMIDRDAVGVELLDGHVSLTGIVPTRSDARLLEELVRRVEGVVGVEADLSWNVDDTKPPHLDGPS